MKQTAISHNWDLNFVDIAKIWRGGCIIRSKFLNNIMDAYLANKDLLNLMMDKFFSEILKESLESYKVILTEAIKHDIPTPTLSSALNYFNSYRTGNLPTNLIQAQRDYFGAHTYERTDKKSGEFFHTNWTGKGGKTSSTTYNS